MLVLSQNIATWKPVNALKISELDSGSKIYLFVQPSLASQCADTPLRIELNRTNKIIFIENFNELLYT